MRIAQSLSDDLAKLNEAVKSAADKKKDFAAAVNARSQEKSGSSRGSGPGYVPQPHGDPQAEAKVRAEVEKLSQRLSNLTLGSGDSLAAADAKAAEEKKKAEDAQVDEAVREVKNSVRTESPVAAATTLKRNLASLPPERRKEVLERLKQEGVLEQLTEKMTGCNKEDTARTLQELTFTTKLVGADGASLITDPIAKAIADGRLEQKGASANGGPFGVFRGANKHNSEREFVDGIALLGNSPEAQLFKDSLVASLVKESKSSQGERSERAMGMAAAVATGDSKLVPDKGVWTAVRNGEIGGVVGAAVARFEKAREEALDAAIEKTTNLSESIDNLKPGESLKISLKGEVDARVDVAAGAGVEITRNDDGTYTVKGSAEVLAGLGIKGKSGAEKLGVKAGVGGTAEFTFKSAEEAKQGAQALIKMEAAAFAGGVPGMLLQPSAEEAALLNKNISAVQFDLKAQISAGVDIGTTGGARIEFENGKPVAVSIINTISGSGSLGFMEKATGYKFSGEVTGTVTQRFSLESLPEGGLTEQVAAIQQDPGKYIRDTDPTISLSLTAKGTADGKGGDAGIEAEIKVENIKVNQLGTFMDRLKTGDIEGALATTGMTATLSWNTFVDETRGWLNQGLDLQVVSVSGENYIHHVGEKHEMKIKPSEDGKHLVNS